MSTKKNYTAIILAAGLGTRLSPITKKVPKCLVPVKEKSILQYQLDALIENQVKQIFIIVGYKSEAIASFLKIYDVPPSVRIRLIKNEDYNSTNNMYSFYLSIEHFDKTTDSIILMNGDVVIAPKIIELIINSEYDNLILVDKGKYNEESMKIVVNEGLVQQISKEIMPNEAYGVSIDVYKFSKLGLAELIEVTTDFIAHKKILNRWMEVAIQAVLNRNKTHIYPCDIQGLPWWEIDNHDDLLQAERIFHNYYNFQQILAKELFIFDLDGTIYLGNNPLPGVEDFLKYLHSKGKRILFLSNNSSKSYHTYLKKLQKMFGAVVTAENIYLSTHSTIEYLQFLGINKVYVMGTPELISDLKENGIHHTEENPQAVIIGFDMTLTYEKLVKVTKFINNGLKYYMTHADLVCPTPDGVIPDAGSLLALIEAATNKKPQEIFGKPNRRLIENILRREHLDKSAAVLFGDRLYTDIRMAKENGILAVLLLTGDTSINDVRNSELKPDFIFDDFIEFNKLFKKNE
ncbi:MAG: HAD-IIA family hydrolase [Candidatus Helarchaeota archaeon]